MPGAELHHQNQEGEPIATVESPEADLIEGKRPELKAAVGHFDTPPDTDYLPDVETLRGSFMLQVENCGTTPQCAYEATMDNGELKISVLLRWLPFVSAIGDFYEGKISMPIMPDEPAEKTVERLNGLLTEHIDNTLRELSIKEGAYLQKGAGVNNRIRRWSGKHDLSEQLRFLKDVSKIEIRREAENMLRTLGMIA